MLLELHRNDTTHLNMGLSVSKLSNTVHSRTQFPCAWTKLYKGCARTFSTNFASNQSVGRSFAADTSIYAVLQFLRTAIVSENSYYSRKFQ